MDQYHGRHDGLPVTVRPWEHHSQPDQWVVNGSFVAGSPTVMQRRTQPPAPELPLVSSLSNAGISLSFINRQRAWKPRFHSYSRHSFSLQSLIPVAVTHFYSTTRSNIATCIIQQLVLYNNLYHTTTGAYTPTSSHTTTCTLPIQQLVLTQVDPQEWTGLIISSE